MITDKQRRQRKANAKWRKLHPVEAKTAIDKWRADNKEHIRRYNKKWRAKKKAHRRRYAVRYRKENPELVRAARRRKSKHERQRAKGDLNLRLRFLFRSSISKAIRTQQGKKSASVVKLIGCSMADFRIYLESRFEPGMTWENYGTVWEIDHEVPCALFDLKRPSHQRRCFHFSNMQPMFAPENRRKGARLVTAQFRLL